MPDATEHSGKSSQGRRNYHSGLSAEDVVATYFEELECEILDRRWRGRSGEVDLIVRRGRLWVFVEVKKADTHDQAALRLAEAQIGRIASAAEEYVAAHEDGTGVCMRIDGALVDAQYRVKIIKNISIL